MDQANNLITGFISSSSEYIQLQSRSVRIGFYQKTTDAVTGAVQWMVLAALAIITYLFLNIGMAFLLGTMTGSLILGFFIICGFNLLLLVFCYFTKRTLGKKKLQNAVLHFVSGTMQDYDQLLKQQMQLQTEIAVAEQKLKESADHLKQKLSSLEDQVSSLTGQFANDNNSGEGNSLARKAVTTGIGILLNTFVFRNAGIVKRTLLPVITHAIVSSKLFKEKNKNNVLESLRLKLRHVLK